jgi:hypothetical protein
MKDPMNLAPSGTLFDDITGFLLSKPSAQEVMDYQVAEPLDARLHELLDKNSQTSLSRDEQTELDTFLQFAHVLTLLKAKALELLEEDE